MAINRRPSGWLYNGDPDYKGTTVAERRSIQNQIDIENQIMESNRIEQEKLDLLRQQEIRNNRRQQNDELNQQIIGILMKGALRYQQEEELCNSLNVSYKDLLEFMNIINSSSIQLQELLNEKLTLEEELNLKIKNKPTKDLNIDKQLQAISQLEKENSCLSKIFDRKKIAKNKESIKYIKQQIELGKKEYLNQYDTILKDYEEKVSKLKKSLEKINGKIEIENNKPTLKTDFNKFRETHYNIDIELLFKRLELNLDKVECEQEGKIEDYIQYFKTKILES